MHIFYNILQCCKIQKIFLTVHSPVVSCDYRYYTRLDDENTLAKLVDTKIKMRRTKFRVILFSHTFDPQTQRQLKFREN